MEHADRLVALVLHLQAPEWRTAAQLGEYVGVSPRTIYRDVQVLAAAGVPVEGTRGHGYRLRAGYLLPPLALTRDEAIALLAQVTVAPTLASDSASRAARAARMKLRALLPASATTEAAALAEDHRARLFTEPAAIHAEGESDGWRIARTAVDQGCVLRLHQDAAVHAHFEPYGFVKQMGRWLVVGSGRDTHGRRTVRALPLTELADAVMTTERFERPAGYAAANVPAASDLAARVVVRFGADAAQVAEVSALPPGAYAATWDDEGAPDAHILAFSIARAEEAVAWVLGFGSHAEVLAPESLRAHLAREARRLAERYRAPEPTLF